MVTQRTRWHLRFTLCFCRSGCWAVKMCVNAIAIVIYYQSYLYRDNFVKTPPKCPTNRLCCFKVYSPCMGMAIIHTSQHNMGWVFYIFFALHYDIKHKTYSGLCQNKQLQCIMTRQQPFTNVMRRNMRKWNAQMLFEFKNGINVIISISHIYTHHGLEE